MILHLHSRGFGSSNNNNNRNNGANGARSSGPSSGYSRTPQVGNAPALDGICHMFVANAFLDKRTYASLNISPCTGNCAWRHDSPPVASDSSQFKTAYINRIKKGRTHLRDALVTELLKL